MSHDPQSASSSSHPHAAATASPAKGKNERPVLRMAVVEPNVLACMGLENTLRKIIPIAEVCTFSSYEALVAAEAESFAHFFVAARIYFEHTHFFRRRPFATIVLTNGENLPPTPGLLTLNVCQSEEALIKSLLEFHALGHGAGPHRPRMGASHAAPTTSAHEMAHRGMPPHDAAHKAPHGEHPHGHLLREGVPHSSGEAVHEAAEAKSPLTLREIEVATHLARGYTNKEVAEQLNISLSTVITHRKNLMLKLGAHSLSDIIIYAVMNGHLDLGV